MLIDIFYAICLIAMGVVILKYRKVVRTWTGTFYWAERSIGRGGTYLIIMLIGVLLIFLGVIYPFGGVDLLTGGGGELNQGEFKVNK
ncbi:hypothetical protein CSA08_03170 [Candidatus Gracilibacteria bacterium]|nr:MAG: hypothetical protein CSA08_03170 [Candidatus Gracilibacteria bacterium]